MSTGMREPELIVKVSRTLPIGDARLEVVFSHEPVVTYSEGGRAFFTAQIVEPGCTTAIGSTDALVRWAQARGADLVSAVAMGPAEFAWFVARIDLHLRSIELPSLYDYVEEQLEVVVAQETPRVEERCCRFLAGEFSLAESCAYKIWRVCVDLETGVIERREVPRRGT